MVQDRQVKGRVKAEVKGVDRVKARVEAVGKAVGKAVVEVGVMDQLEECAVPASAHRGAPRQFPGRMMPDPVSHASLLRWTKMSVRCAPLASRFAQPMRSPWTKR